MYKVRKLETKALNCFIVMRKKTEKGKNLAPSPKINLKLFKSNSKN